MTGDRREVTVSEAVSRAGLEQVEADWRWAVASGDPSKYQAITGAFHPRLTMAEGLKPAAQEFRKEVEHLSCCAA